MYQRAEREYGTRGKNLNAESCDTWLVFDRGIIPKVEGWCRLRGLRESAAVLEGIASSGVLHHSARAPGADFVSFAPLVDEQKLREDPLVKPGTVSAGIPPARRRTLQATS